MTSPPANRRPGIDADIVQATTVRGYDSPLDTEPPCDLTISPGQNTANLDLADVLFWSRSNDPNQPIWIGLQGTTPLIPVGRVAFHIGSAADPNGLVTAPKGSLYVSYGTPSTWQNQDDATTWTEISDDLGGENLEETLAIGDFTGSQRIVISRTSSGIIGDEGTGLQAGGDVIIRGGPATGAAGTGGDVSIISGLSAKAGSGSINIQTQPPYGTAASGGILMETADSLTGGASGNLAIQTGEVGAPGLGGFAGALTILSGGSFAATGVFAKAGDISILGGQAYSDGQGANINIRAGSSSAGIFPPPVPPIAAGQGGSVSIAAGLSSQGQTGGDVNLDAGAGGPAGAAGGNINLRVGYGGGGWPNGEIIGQGNLRSDNIQRGSGNPNDAGGTPGNEGDVYQRTDTAQGQLWLNVNGEPTGWVQLAFSGDFLESYEQMNWGHVCRSGRNVTLTDEDVFDDIGLFKGLRTVDSDAGSFPTMGAPNRAGPFIRFTAQAGNKLSAMDMNPPGGGFTLPHELQQRFIATFRARNVSSDADHTIFMGFSDLSADDQVLTPLPVGRYVGFLLSSPTTDWRAVAGNTIGATAVGTGVLKSTVAAASVPYHFVIDATESGLGAGANVGTIRFYILDEDLNLISSTSINTNLPEGDWNLGLVVAVKSTAATRTLELNHATLVNQGDIIAQGGGTAVGALSLAQVLINGNTTGNNWIVVNHGATGGGLVGETDDAFGDGANVSVFSGPTTGAGNDTGSNTFGSWIRTIAGSGNTGTVFLETGLQSNAGATGDTGTLTISTGPHWGTGNTGDLILATGYHLGSGEQGDIHIAPGTFFPAFATTAGNLTLKGGSTLASGIAGGNVTILSGESAGAATSLTGEIAIQTYNASVNGDSGHIYIDTGDAGTTTGNSGNILIGTGQSANGDSGVIHLTTATAGNGTAGHLWMLLGNTTVGNGADVVVTASTTTDGTAVGGNVILNPGGGGTAPGAVIVNGKLTVTGPIDPTAIGFTGVGASPLAIGSGIDGILWVDNTGPDGRLIYENSSGSWDISTGGGATTLGALTDVTITAPTAGDVLRLNSVLQWVNLPGTGGSGLPTTLGINSTTGGTAGGITVSGTLGDRIASDDDLVLDPAGAPGNAVVIDGLRWPEADGMAGYVITTNGLGDLSFQPGGGGSGQTFAETFASMQWGSAQAVGAPGTLTTYGMFNSIIMVTAGPVNIVDDQGTYTIFPTGTTPGDEAGAIVVASKVQLNARPISVFHFSTLPTPGGRLFVGLTTDPGSSPLSMLSSPTPPQSYVGIEIMSDAIPGQTDFHFVTDNNTLSPLLVNTGITPGVSNGFWLTIDATVSSEVTLTLYDEDRNVLATHTFTSNLPTASAELNHFAAVLSISGTVQYMMLWEFSAVTRADVLQAIGGGGNQNLASVLGFGNETGGLPIQGDDNAGGSGLSLDLFGGSSTGGGGNGGYVNLMAGSPDPAGGIGGSITFLATAGTGTGSGGGFALIAGPGAGGGSGGDFALALGPGSGAGSGGSFAVACGPGGSGGGTAGIIAMTTGSGTGGGAAGGAFQVSCGSGNGVGGGGLIQMAAGNGGSAGPGGDIQFAVGTGNGGAPDGKFYVTGDVDITGKLTVSGMIDPPGLLMADSGSVPFTPVGSEGGLWVNTSGELIYTNTGGDLNLSTAIGGGLGFLDALLISGYGFLGPGNSVGGPQSYGVYGSSVNSAVVPPASITFSEDTEGPMLTLALGGVANSEAFVGTDELFIRRDQQFKAVFKFQSTSPAHTDERIFIGFTDDPYLTNNQPGSQLSDPGMDPPLRQYVGLRQTQAGSNLEFVSRGSGGASAPVFAIPTDALAHYLQIDASSSSGAVTLTLYAADGITVEATTTIPASTLLPDLTTDLRPFVGLRSQATSTPRTLDFYFSSIVSRADVIEAVVSGGAIGSQSLDQVLLVGNLTGGTDIELTNNSQIIGQDLAIGTGGNVEVVAGDETAGTPVASGGSVTLTPGAVTGAPGGDAGQIWIGSTLAGGSGIDGNAGSGVDDGGDGAEIQVWLGAGGINASGNAGDAGDFLIWAEAGGQAQNGVSPVSGGNSSMFGWFGLEGGDASHTAGGSAVGGDSGDFYVEIDRAGHAQGNTGATGGDSGSLEFFGGSGGQAQSTASGTAQGGQAGDSVFILGSGGDADGYAGATGGGGPSCVQILGGGGTAVTSFSGIATGGSAGDVITIVGPGGQVQGHAGAIGGNAGNHGFIFGDGGDAESLTSGTATGGTGADFITLCGNGGNASGFAGGTGGAGGDISLLTGNGGEAEARDSGTAAGGAGGPIQGALGSGRKGTGITGATGGGGGAFNFALGSGGDAEISDTGSAIAGAGGGLAFALGSGGTAYAGTAANSLGTGGSGGACAIVTGSGGNADEGTLPGSAGFGGNIDFVAGMGGSGVSFDNAGGDGGWIAGVAGNGGGGAGTENAGHGGLVAFVAGHGGNASGTGQGGDGGTATLIAGNAGTGTPDGTPGDVLIAAGGPGTPGTGGGKITFGSASNEDVIDNASPAMQFGNFPLPGGGGPYTVPFNLPGFISPPRTVLITIESGPPSAPGQFVHVVGGSITPFTFDILETIPFVGGEIVHWVAYL